MQNPIFGPKQREIESARRVPQCQKKQVRQRR
jgi:hypothetical protein